MAQSSALSPCEGKACRISNTKKMALEFELSEAIFLVSLLIFKSKLPCISFDKQDKLMLHSSRKMRADSHPGFT